MLLQKLRRILHGFQLVAALGEAVPFVVVDVVTQMSKLFDKLKTNAYNEIKPQPKYCPYGWVGRKALGCPPSAQAPCLCTGVFLLA